ncbi:hypothetical protein ACFRCR_02985 [Oerskovia sp. NPDC056781]|uniref:hypothetical protein n=1 Tax=Oerskovia sp. NPDC056781 TaxID=3345942 RepID=UPI00366DA71A
MEAGTLSATIKAQQRVSRVLTQATLVAAGIEAFDVDAYNTTRTIMAALEIDYALVRTELFEAADLPAAPDDTWKTFVEVGESYRQHLVTAGAHDENRCLYCRQPLGERAQELVAKYADYLADKIGADIAESRKSLAAATAAVASINAPEVTAWVTELADQTERPDFYAHVASIVSVLDGVKASTSSGTAVDPELTARVAAAHAVLTVRLAEVDGEVKVLESEDANRAEALQSRRRELVELTAAAEVGRSWTVINTQVKNAKEADRLRVLARPALALRRAVTALSKIASDALINQCFAAYFAEECGSLRAPSLKVEYIGRDGSAKRRKVLVSSTTPSPAWTTAASTRSPHGSRIWRRAPRS